MAAEVDLADIRKRKGSEIGGGVGVPVRAGHMHIVDVEPARSRGATISLRKSVSAWVLSEKSR